MLVAGALHRLSALLLSLSLRVSSGWEALHEHLRSLCLLCRNIHYDMLVSLRIADAGIPAHLVLFKLFLVALGATPL